MKLDYETTVKQRLEGCEYCLEKGSDYSVTFFNPAYRFFLSPAKYRS